MWQMDEYLYMCDLENGESTTKCPICKKEFEENSQECPFCGYKFAQTFYAEYKRYVPDLTVK